MSMTPTLFTSCNTLPSEGAQASLEAARQEA